VYGLHNAPFPLYSVHVRPGAVMAHEVEFYIDIHGIGGHGSTPQQCVDPILAGSAVVQALQTVVSRSLSPMDTAVVSVTQFRGGDANNVIPSRVYLAGTIRDFDLQVAEKIKDRFAKLVHSTCGAYGATASVHFLDGYAPVINPHVETRQVQQVAMDMGMYVSEEGLPLMAAEDFSYFLQERKGCYFFLGTKEEGDADKTRALHSNHYDFNDKAIPLGIRLFLGILQSRFKCELYSMEEMQAFQVAMERIMINVTVV
jgi:amidohydrolase